MCDKWKHDCATCRWWSKAKGCFIKNPTCYHYELDMGLFGAENKQDPHRPLYYDNYKQLPAVGDKRYRYYANGVPCVWNGSKYEIMLNK